MFVVKERLDLIDYFLEEYEELKGEVIVKKKEGEIVFTSKDDYFAYLELITLLEIWGY